MATIDDILYGASSSGGGGRAWQAGGKAPAKGTQGPSGGTAKGAEQPKEQEGSGKTALPASAQQAQAKGTQGQQAEGHLGNDARGGGSGDSAGAASRGAAASGNGSADGGDGGSADKGGEHHGKVVRDFGDGIHAFMEDGTIRTSGVAGYTYSDPGGLTNVDLYKILNPYKPMSAEEKAKAAKKEKREKIFAALGDGISALSNLYFTTQYAPSMYDGKDSMSERARVRYDRLMKEREGNEKEYFAGLLKARMADNDGKEREREWQRKKDKDERDRKRAEAKDERDRELFDLKLKLEGHKISAAEAQAEKDKIEAKYAEALNKGKVATEEAKARYYSKGGSRGGGTPGEYPWYDSDAKKHYAHSYEAMRQNAIDHGTWNETTQTSTTETKNRSGRTQKTTETTRTGKGHSTRPQKPQKHTGLGLGSGEEKKNQNNVKKTGLGL